FLEDGASLASRTMAAQWHDALDPARGWLPASAGLRAQHTNLLSSLAPSAGRARRSPFPPWEQRERESGGAVDPAQTRASPGVGARGSVGWGTGSVRPYARATRAPPVWWAAC